MDVKGRWTVTGACGPYNLGGSAIVHPSLVGLDPSDFETTGPLEYSECPRECWGPFGIVTVVIYGVADIEWLEG